MDRLTVFGTISLGGLIDALKGREQDQTVRFDFGGFVPSGIGSYRGYYDHLAIAFDPESCSNWSSKEITVALFLKMLYKADGKRYTGYKGGEYLMGMHSPVWVGNYGSSTGTAIVGLAECNYMTVISTAFVE